MQIDPKKCVACGNCLPVCPVGAIHIDPQALRAAIRQDDCVECFACFRGMSMENLNPVLIRGIRFFLRLFRLRFDPEPDVCPTSAITPQELHWPRIVRRAFSDPLMPHESTGIHGRGTEEIKTNDVTGRIGFGEAGFTVEFGRPGVATRFRDIEKMTTVLAAEGLVFEERNPITHLMSDRTGGRIREDILDERILSAIVEFKTTLEKVPHLLRTIRSVAGTLDTVVLVGVSTRCDSSGDNHLEGLLDREGFEYKWSKTNVGLATAMPSASLES
jgi:ferredoxin